MSRRLEHTMAFAVPAHAVYAAYDQRAYWEALVEGYRQVAPQSELTGFRSGPDGIDVAFRQVLPGADLPAIVRKVIPRDMAITRSQHFDPFDPDAGGAGGRFSASVPRAPGRLDGHCALSQTSDGSRLALASTCKVSVPLIGGKLEGMVMSLVQEIFTVEEAFTADWVTEHL